MTRNRIKMSIVNSHVLLIGNASVGKSTYIEEMLYPHDSNSIELNMVYTPSPGCRVYRTAPSVNEGTRESRNVNIYDIASWLYYAPVMPHYYRIATAIYVFAEASVVGMEASRRWFDEATLQSRGSFDPTMNLLRSVEPRFRHMTGALLSRTPTHTQTPIHLILTKCDLYSDFCNSPEYNQMCQSFRTDYGLDTVTCVSLETLTNVHSVGRQAIREAVLCEHERWLQETHTLPQAVDAFYGASHSV